MKIIECPRDAMQGLETFIETDKKAAYINQLLKVGFDTIDFGSFVSPKAIPQMRDTADVLNKLDLSSTSSKLLSIVANMKGAENACEFDEINYLGFPFSVSETFLQRNTNSTIEESLVRVEAIQNLCQKTNKELVVYLSMGFGNPYGDKWSPELVAMWSYRLYKEFGIKILAVSDTIGVATSEVIAPLYKTLIAELPDVEFGAHFHTTPTAWLEKVQSAYESGCRRFDGAIKGFGGCPMAADKLTGNMPTENMISWFSKNNIDLTLNQKEFENSMLMASEIFPQ